MKTRYAVLRLCVRSHVLAARRRAGLLTHVLRGWVALAVALGGCTARGPIVPRDLNPVPIPTAAAPDYADLVRAYNANASAVDRVYVKTDVALRWREDDGRERRESGDGRLIFRRPLDTALTVEVLGDVKIWAGSDDRAFWMFDLFDTETAYHGDYGQPIRRRLPLPIQPEVMPYLLGLMPLDPDRRPAAPEVELINGYAVIEPPGLNLRMQMHPETGRLTRVELTDFAGASVLSAVLTGELTVPASTPSGPTATLPGTIELYPQGDGSRMTVVLKSPQKPERIRGTWFRFEDLRKKLRPAKVESLNEPE